MMGAGLCWISLSLSLTRTQSPVSRDAEHSDFAMHAYFAGYRPIFEAEPSQTCRQEPKVDKQSSERWLPNLQH